VQTDLRTDEGTK